MELVWFRLCDTRRQDSLLLHPVGLGTQNETEKIIIRNSCSLICRGRSSTPLVVQPGALALHQHVEKDIIPLRLLSACLEAAVQGGCVRGICAGDWDLWVNLICAGGGGCTRRVEGAET